MEKNIGWLHVEYDGRSIEGHLQVSAQPNDDIDRSMTVYVNNGETSVPLTVSQFGAAEVLKDSSNSTITDSSNSAIKVGKSWFRGVTTDGSSYSVQLYGTTSTTVGSGEERVVDGSSTSGYAMFAGASKLASLDTSKLDTSLYTDMRLMFRNLPVANLDLRRMDTQRVTQMTSFALGSLIRNIIVSPAFFYTTAPIDLSTANYLGMDADGESVGCLEHLAATAPYIIDCKRRIIKLSSTLKSKMWALESMATLQSKGYTIA